MTSFVVYLWFICLRGVIREKTNPLRYKLFCVPVSLLTLAIGLYGVFCLVGLTVRVLTLTGWNTTVMSLLGLAPFLCMELLFCGIYIQTHWYIFMEEVRQARSKALLEQRRQA